MGSGIYVSKVIEKARGLTAEPAEGAAAILLGLGLDEDCVAAGLLCRTQFSEQNSGLQALEGVRSKLGEGVWSLLRDTAKTAALSRSEAEKTLSGAEHIRKMLFALVDDIRVIFIKLADKLDTLRTLDNALSGASYQPLPETEIKRIASECLDIYAPLAGRLGIQQIKDELEDISFKLLHRGAYEQIKEIVALKKGERGDFLLQVKDAALLQAAKANIQIEVKTRAKHFYSIYKKMRKRGKAADELFDLFGLRVICQSVEQCYTLLGICHKLWKPVDGRFKDYIAMPKSNGYKSLHTTVIADGTPLEIQIRTAEMHKTAEFGVASHWLYKKNMGSEVVRLEDLPIINRLKEWRVHNDDKLGGADGTVYNTQTGDTDFLAEIKRELLKDSIFVFTPLGKVIELPPGACALDFAYAIHSDIGEHCHLAKANGRAVPLSAPLQNTQVVEIITAVNAHPVHNWLSIVKTSKARAKIRAYLASNEEHETPHEAQGEKTKTHSPLQKKEKPVKPGASFSARPVLTVRVADEKNMLVRFAKCCSPQPGDPITGFVSRGRGFIIHRDDCKNLAHIAGFEERRVNAEWEN